MKKLLFYLALTLFLQNVSAQSNLNLEIWGGNNLNPAEWTTLNVLAQLGTQTTFKETANPGQGAASAKMVTAFCSLCAMYSVPLDTVGGIIITGDTATGTSGIPYTQTPQYLSFRYKAAPQAGDAGIVSVQLTRYDTLADSTIIIAEGFFLETNVVSSWTDMLLPIQYYSAEIPDTLIIAASSSASFLYSGSPLLGVKKIGSEFNVDTFNLHTSFPCSFSDLSVSVFSTNESAPGASDGSAYATVNGGISPYSYSWSNGSALDSISNLSAGTYSISVTDSLGCSVTGSAIISSGSCTLTLSASATDETAPGATDGTATVIASGGTSPYSFNWSNGTYSSTISNLSPGTYAVTVTDASGCKDSATVVVNAYNCTMSLSVTSTAETAPGVNDGSATVSVSGGTNPYSVNWSDGQTTITATGLTPALYYITVTDAIGCTATDSIVVDSFICSFSVSATATDETSLGANDGTVSVSSNGGISPYFYFWNNGDSASVINGLAPGTYSVTVSDGNNCSDTASANVYPGSVCGNFYISNISITDPLCNGDSNGQITVTANGGAGILTFTWSNGNSGNTAFYVYSGNYSVTVSDMNNCILDTAVSVSEPLPLSLSISHTDETCSACSDGTVSAAVAGGVPPYSYSWTNGQNSPVISNLPAGVYGVLVLDANGCMVSGSDTVRPAVLEIADASGNDFSFRIQPNPNEGIFQLFFSAGYSNEFVKTEVLNLLGERVYFSVQNIHNCWIDISKFPPGIYLLEITGEKNRISQKIVLSGQ